MFCHLKVFPPTDREASCICSSRQNAALDLHFPSLPVRGSAGYLRMVQRCLHRSTHFILEKYVLFSPLRQPCVVAVFIRPCCWAFKAFIACEGRKGMWLKCKSFMKNWTALFILSPGSVNDWKSPSGPKDLQATCCFSSLVQFLLPWLATAPTPTPKHFL